jgi:glycosyltransferase involved in cell wall biosynthesis
MRILWLCHFVPWPPIGHGSLQRSYHLLRVAAATHDVHLLALAPPSVAAAGLDLEVATLALRQMCSVAEVFPLPRDPRKLRRAWLLLGGVPRRQSHWERWFHSRAMEHRVRELRRGFDLVHVESVVLGAYRKAIADSPAILSHHNVESALVRQRSGTVRNAIARSLLLHEASKLEALERDWAPKARVNVVVSELDGTRLSRLAPQAKVDVVPNGVDTDYFRPVPGILPETSTLAFAGGMEWFPNRDAMIHFARDIWPRVASMNERRRAIIIGHNPPTELSALRDSRLEVLGFVPDIRPHISRAAIYICPMRVGGGTRLKILDALSMSRALVSTDLGVEGFDLVPDVHFLRANTPEEFERQITRLENDEALRLRLGRSGRELVENRFSWDVVGKTLLESYERAAAVSRRPSR